MLQAHYHLDTSIILQNIPHTSLLTDVWFTLVCTMRSSTTQLFRSAVFSSFLKDKIHKIPSCNWGCRNMCIPPRTPLRSAASPLKSELACSQTTHQGFPSFCLVLADGATTGEKKKKKPRKQYSGERPDERNPWTCLIHQAVADIFWKEQLQHRLPCWFVQGGLTPAEPQQEEGEEHPTSTHSISPYGSFAFGVIPCPEPC